MENHHSTDEGVFSPLDGNLAFLAVMIPISERMRNMLGMFRVALRDPNSHVTKGLGKPSEKIVLAAWHNATMTAFVDSWFDAMGLDREDFPDSLILKMRAASVAGLDAMYRQYLEDKEGDGYGEED